jgi:O-antigen/teichoic acid export membrane protein
LLKEIAGFAGWNLSAHLVNMAKTQGVSILLNIFHGPVCNAARGIACQVQGMLLQFSDNFQVATVPQITKNYAQGDVKGMNELIIRGSKISLSLLIIVMLPFIIETEKVLGIWLGQVPTHTVVFTRLCLIATLCNALSGLLVYGALATGNVKNYQIIMSSIISLQFFVVWYLFSKKANPEVMYITEIICYVIALFVRLVLLKKMVHFPVFRYLKDVFLKSLVLVCISLVIPYVLHTSIENNFCRIFVVFLTSVLISVLLTIMIILNQHERKIIFKALKSKLYH